jgi:transposase-like protein
MHLARRIGLLHPVLEKGALMQRTPGKTNEERERYWIKIIRKARRYAKGVSAFCADHGIAKDNYYSWFRKLRPKHPEWQENSSSPSTEAPLQLVAPKTEVEERPQRRKFTAAYKARILKEAEAASDGETAALLRREGLYASHLYKWRKERDLAALEPKKRGRKANPLLAENKKLQAKNARLEKQLEQANAIIELQKKIAKILGDTLEEPTEAD